MIALKIYLIGCLISASFLSLWIYLKVKNGKTTLIKNVNIKSGGFLTIITYEIKDGKVKFLSQK